MPQKLFEEFAPITDEQWLAQVQQDLKGGDFDKRLVSKTLDGLEIRPYYRKGDLPASAATSPGVMPFRRGYQTDANDWLVREQIRQPDRAEANAHAKRALMRGAQELSVLTYPIGVPINTQDDLAQFLDGIFIEMVPIHWLSGPFSAQILAMVLNEAERRGVSPEDLTGSVDNDPILDSVCGWVDAPAEAWKDRLIPVLKQMMDHGTAMSRLTIRGSLIEKSGASVAQELALSMALLVEYLTGLREEGFDLADVVSHTEMRYAVGSHYFLEIAKLRAQRVLLQNVLKAFGIEGFRPHIHVDTTSSNKTLYDPYNNLLRGTTEAMSAALAGVDSLSVAAFDQGYNSPDEFSGHIARNTETLLKEEAFLTKVVDPLGGSYYVEVLTDSLANAAWDLFLRIENEGGFIRAWNSGLIPSELDRIRAEKIKRVNSRRVPIVGTSVYPNLKEKRLGDVRSFPKAYVLKSWQDINADFQNMRYELLGGRALEVWKTDRPVPSTALNPFRPAWPFEHLRLRVERHEADGGKRPIVRLAELGDPKMRAARSAFCLGFLGAGGYDVRVSKFKTAAEAVSTANEEGADLLVLCSADDAYLSLTQEAAAAGPKSPLFIAGLPANADEIKAAGAADFIHVRLDVVETLTQLHARFGITEQTV